MRIISSFRDFYDGVQKEGQDLNLLYIRNSSQIIFDNKFKQGRWGHWQDGYPFARIERWGSGNHLTSRDYTIGFCGKLYPAVKLSISKYKNYAWEETDIKICYSLSSVVDYIVQRFPNKEVNLFMTKRYNSTWTGLSIETFKSFFKWFDSNNAKHESLFVDNKAPVFVGKVENHERVINFNCDLQPYEFYRVKDPYTAFQDISMWLSNQANPHKPIPAVSDKDLASAKGFDKWSFRKEPSK